jgi:hypothetical protein
MLAANVLPEPAFWETQSATGLCVIEKSTALVIYLHVYIYFGSAGI